MKLVIFGLSISSSWGNGHATLWRGLHKALGRRGVHFVFFERDVPYYAEHRDLSELIPGKLALYRAWDEAARLAEVELADADVALVTSYCPDGIAATKAVSSSPVRARVFYDLDTPVTLGQLSRGANVSYIGPEGLSEFDLVLSYTGGMALEALRTQLGARRVATLYGSVDPEVHQPAVPQPVRADLSYLGTYAADRQTKLEQLFIEPARQLPGRRFLLGGAQYPAEFPWTSNIYFLGHQQPDQHAQFYASSRLTLNITRADMAAMGYCPSGRLFEAAAANTPILSDTWEGLETFFEPGREILIAESTSEAVQAIELSDRKLRRMAAAARDRTLSKYTATHRADELLSTLDRLLSGGWNEEDSLAAPLSQTPR